MFFQKLQNCSTWNHAKRSHKGSSYTIVYCLCWFRRRKVYHCCIHSVHFRKAYGISSRRFSLSDWVQRQHREPRSLQDAYHYLHSFTFVSDTRTEGIEPVLRREKHEERIPLSSSCSLIPVCVILEKLCFPLLQMSNHKEFKLVYFAVSVAWTTCVAGFIFTAGPPLRRGVETILIDSALLCLTSSTVYIFYSPSLNGEQQL